MAKYSMDDIALKLQGRPSGVVGKRREYAVLMPLVKVNGEICFLFEVRSQDVAQPGDVCFPGGRIEEGETVVEAAVREAREEIGLEQEDLRLFGRFDSMMEVGRIVMHTVVGEIKEEAISRLILDSEVKECFTVPLRFFADNEPDMHRIPLIQSTEGFPFEKHGIDPNYKWRTAYADTYFWHYEGHLIWGLTAGIVRWFMEEIIDKIES